MDEPIAILLNALYDHDLSWEEAKSIVRPLEDDEDILSLTKWVMHHHEASIREITKEMHSFLRKQAT